MGVSWKLMPIVMSKMMLEKEYMWRGFEIQISIEFIEIYPY